MGLHSQNSRLLQMPHMESTFNYLWQALRLFNLYRTVLAFGFVAVILLHLDINFLGVFDATLYRRITAIYLFLSLFFLLLSTLYKQQYLFQANIPIFIDIFIITILMHACGGIISGVGILLIIIVAAHSILSPGKYSLLSATLATIAIFTEQSLSYSTDHIGIGMYTQVGLLGAVILATSFVTNLLSIRTHKSLLIVENQAEQLATSQQLNAHIISAMQSGVLVLDNRQHVRLVNTATKRLLGLQGKTIIQNLGDLPIPFQVCFQEWQLNHHAPIIQTISPSGTEIRLSFHVLGKGLPAGTLVFLYDAAEETRQAQDLKLASLGHLTANIAHELRNPLGAASHAAQLLAESTIMPQDDLHLVHMIKQSCDRMNTVIQNVLSLSGRKAAQTQRISLVPWLEQFIQELVIPQLPPAQITLQCETQNIEIDIDPSQLTQILINLCENGLRYSFKKNGTPTITLHAHVQDNPRIVYLDVIDQGEGIPHTITKHIFEPFFTTEQAGSGLGLYIAKELSQMNGARLDLHPSQTGCQFRITFPQGEANP